MEQKIGPLLVIIVMAAVVIGALWAGLRFSNVQKAAASTSGSEANYAQLQQSILN